MDLSTYIPKYIAQTEAQVSKYIVTADRWNELWNLSIAQGDYTTEAVDQIITELQTAQLDLDTAEAAIIANNNAAVHKTGDETVAGIKSFSGSRTNINELWVGTSAMFRDVSNAFEMWGGMAGDCLKFLANDLLFNNVKIYDSAELQTSGSAQVHWNNITNKPNLADASWKPSVATASALPVAGNAVGDQRVVLDDGDGKQAIYACVATTGTIDQQWDKIGDVDWLSGEASRVDAEALRVTAETRRVTAEAARGFFGVYAAATAYVVGNKVSYNGSSYICIRNSTGNLPTNDIYWAVLAAKGDKGDTGEQGETGAPGTNLNLKVNRQYDAYEDLPTNPDIGYMCLVGSDLYIFADNGWVNAGKLTDIDYDLFINIDGGLFTDEHGVIIGESALEALQDHTTDDDTHANLIIDGMEV